MILKMALVTKPDFNLIFASQAPSVDLPPQFNNYVRGMDETRKNNGKPTIKQFNYLHQNLDLKLLWILQNGAALPYDPSIEYAENSLAVKDGELQQFIGGVWLPFKKTVDASDVKDESGLSQQEWNNGVESIADLIAISNPENGNRLYVNGIQHGWFKYNASRSSENDGGTIFNGWERMDFQAITFDMFDCDSTGGIAIDDKLLKICAASTALKKPIHNFTGTYLVSGSNEFVFTENTFLDGSKFKLDATFSGRFTCKRNDTSETVLTSGAVFDEIKAIGIFQAGRFNLLNTPTFAVQAMGSYAEFRTTQPLYIYRGVTKGAKLFTRILRNGRIENAPYFNIDLAQLSSVRLQSVAESVRVYSGFCFDESLAASVADYFHLDDSNRVVIRNSTYIDKSASYRAVNQTRLTVCNSFNILIDGLDATSVLNNADRTYNYSITLSDCYDIKIKNAKSFGFGWGATGSNNCSSVEFESCTLNRIDFHEPCYDYLKVNNCTVGDWGILVTMVGDLCIDQSTFSNYEGAGNRGIIRSRTDTGGFCYGDLYMSEIKLGGYSGVAMPSVIMCQGDGILPAGSPIEAVMFNNVYINGLRNKYTLAGVNALFTSDSPTTLNKPPKVIEVEKVHRLNPLIDFGKFALQSDVVQLTMRDIQHNTLYISDAESKGTKIEAIIDGARHRNGVDVISTANCDMQIVNSKLVRYREYNTVWNAFNPQVRISNSQMSANEYVSLNTGVTNNRVTLRDISFTNPAATSILSMSPKAKHYNCTFNGSAYATVWTGTGVNTGSFNIHMDSGIIDLVVWYGSNKKFISIDPSVAQTYTIETGVTIVVTIVGTTATVTLNATNAKLIAIRNSL